MARTDPQVNIRMSSDLIQKIEVAALANNRTFKAEIVTRLEQSLSGESLTAIVKQAVLEALTESRTNA